VCVCVCVCVSRFAYFVGVFCCSLRSHGRYNMSLANEWGSSNCYGQAASALIQMQRPATG